MNIGIVIEQFDPYGGGAERWTYQYVTWLRDQGHTVHVVARDGQETTDVTLHRTTGRLSRLEFAAQAEQIARCLPLDLVHDMGSGWYCDVFQPHGGSRRATLRQNMLLRPRWWRPINRRLQSVLPRYREFDRLMERQYVDDGRVLIALSQMVRRDFRQLHEARDEQIRIVYNGVDLERFTPDNQAVHRQATRRKLGVDDQEVLLFLSAHNFRLKGVPTMLRATVALRQAGHPVRLVIAGGKRLRPYQRWIARHGAASFISLVGSVDDPVPLYAAADAYVHPTFYDPCSLVLLEALACGLPVVTSQENGAGELVTSGVEGYLIDNPADDVELAQTLTPLLERSRRESMGLAARSLAERHSLERNCREMLGVYEELLARRASGKAA